MSAKRRMALVYLLIFLVVITFTGCSKPDPNQDIIRDIQKNPKLSDAIISINDDVIDIKVEIDKNEDNENAYKDMFLIAEEIKAEYSNKKVTIMLMRDGSSFGVINL